MTSRRRMGRALCFAGLILFFLSIIAWGTCTTIWHSPSDDDSHEGFSWDNGAGGRTAYDDDRAYTTTNGEEHEYDEYGFTLGGDISATAVIVGFEVRIRGYSVGGGSVSVGLSPDGGSTVDMQAGTMPWVISLPAGSSNEAWNSVNIDNPPFMHTFIPAEVCANDFTVWVKANVFGTAIYVDAVEVRVIYYDEIIFPWNPNNPSSVSSTTHSANVWYNASTLPPEGTTVTLEWNSATDQPTCDSGIDGYRIYWDASSSTNLGASDGYFVDEDGAHTQDFALGSGQYWFHIRSVDNVGHLADTTAHNGPYQYDDTWPTNPNVTTSRATGTWLNSADVPISVSGASDSPSGVDGFETAWTHSASWTHTAAKNKEEGWTGETFTLPNDGVWYFQLATVDNAGNWRPVYETEGWFGVDTHVPTDPTVTSPTHAEGSVSSNSNVQVAVSGATDPQYGESGYENSSGVDGFSVAWDGSAVSPPDAAKDHEQDWTGTTYVLADGTWYFHLRTRDNAGNWTSTEDYGPVTIDTTPPNAPSVTGIADDNGSSSTDEITNDNTLIISGTAEANSTVEVFRDSVSIGTTPANGSGDWTFDYTGTPLSDGSYSFTATATDAAGLTSAASSALNVLIDTQAPPTPSGRTPASGTYTNDNTPTFEWSAPADPGGSGVRDYRIQVIDSGLNVDKDSYPSATSYTPSSGSPLDDDTYTWRLYTRDVAGNTGAWGVEWTLVVDTENPTCMVSTGTATIYDGDLVQEVTIDYSEKMTHTANAPTIVFTGTAGTWSSNGNGLWNVNFDQWTESFTITDAGEDVTATVTASGTEDLAGNTQVSNQTTFAVDTLNPTVTSLYLASSPDTTITDWDVADVTQDGLYVHFSEPMTNDGSADPVFTFDPVITHTLPNGDNSLWDPSSPDTVYGYFTAALDGNVDVDSVDVDVTGARDEHGNLLVPYSQAGVFDIDTLNPTITSVTSTTPDGCYNVGENINVTVSFSENVTCSFQVPLDTGDVIQWGAFALTGTISGTYGVGVGDNSCDLDSGIPSLAGAATLKDAVGNDADLVPPPPTTIADGSNITVDTTDPVINPIASNQTVECDGAGNTAERNAWLNSHGGASATDNCGGATWTNDFTGLSDDCGETGSALVTFTATDACGNFSTTSATFTIEDTTPPSITTPASDEIVECDGAGNVAELNAWLANHGGAVASDTCCGTDVTWSNDFTGLSDDCGETGSALVTFTTTDCCGLSSTTQATFTIEDTTNPMIVWNIDLPASPQYVDPLTCTIAFPIQATVHDACCIIGMGAAWGVTNATVNYTAAVGPPGVIDFLGEFTVSALTGCPAVLYVAINAHDCCGNAATQLTDSVEIYDNTVPVINDLVVDDHVLMSADCCEATVNFTANVTDQCCIVPDNVAVTVMLPTDNAILENIVINRVQNGQGRVDVTGSADVRCLTSCPARVEVHIEATDCCGNGAVPVTSTTTEGRVYDETPPEPKDDPNGDENRSTGDGLEVRLDDNGQYRLMVREDTPVRIDVVWNDTDNCSACACEKHLWIDDIVTPPGYGTATIEDAESSVSAPGTAIRYAPYHGYYGKDEFTYRIVDACGNVSATATVYIEVIPQTVMDDIYLTTCVDTAVSFAVTATDLWIDPEDPGEIPFVFSIVTAPLHGVISGDLGDVTYAAHGGIESATITLVYTPAVGFVGRDVLTLRFADPFGGSSTAVVDIAVIECEGQPGGPPLFIVQQGEIFPLIVPLTFAVVYEKEWHTVTVQAIDATGTLYNEALSATWEESIGRYVLRLDTATLPPGLYRMTIPLGNGETVMLLIEVGEAV